MIKLAVLALIIMVVSAVETSVTAVAGLNPYVSVTLVLVTYLTIMLPDSRPFWFAALAGLVFDLFSPFVFGLHLFVLLGACMLTRVLFLRFFTNRSIYAMVVLMLAASIVSQGLWFGIARLFSLLRFATYTPIFDVRMFWQHLGNVITVILLFYLLVAAERIFGRFFIFRHAR